MEKKLKNQIAPRTVHRDTPYIKYSSVPNFTKQYTENIKLKGGRKELIKVYVDVMKYYHNLSKSACKMITWMLTDESELIVHTSEDDLRITMSKDSFTETSEYSHKVYYKAKYELLDKKIIAKVRNCRNDYYVDPSIINPTVERLFVNKVYTL